jgi:hypothetical protein
VPVGVIVSLVLLVALIVVAALIVRRMGRIVATDRALRAYLEGVAILRRGADPALERGAAAVDALLHGRGTTDAAKAAVDGSIADLAKAREQHRAHEVPPGVAALDAALARAIDTGAAALGAMAAALEELRPGTPREDPGRLAAEREAKRARVAALVAREDIGGLEERIEASSEEVRARTSWGRPARS